MRHFGLLLLVCWSLPLLAETHGAAATGYTADEALARLKNGNERYVEGKPKHPRADVARRAETVKDGQHPFAIVIGCADSREPVELLFDQGVGDVFVIRVAGNVANTDEIGSAEYAAEHLGVPLCLVLGHTKCGAVTAAVGGGDIPGNVGALVNTIKPAVTAAQNAHPELKDKALIPAAIEANVRQAMANLTGKSDVLKHLVSAGKLRIVGGIYDLETGAIAWLDEGKAGKPVAVTEANTPKAEQEAHSGKH
jgi:carbonic anhydrase